MSTAESIDGKAEVKALLGLINTATHDAMEVYERSGHGVPSAYSPQKHPLDTQTTSLALKKAIRVLEGACEQLCSALAPPTHVLLNRSQVHFGPNCLRVVIDARIAEALEDKPQGVHINELAKKANIDSTKLYKVMRALATRHCFNEVQPNVFANNRQSLALAEPETAAVLGICTGLIQDASGALRHAIKDPSYGPSRQPSKSPLMYHLRKNEDLDGDVDWFKYRETHPAEANDFTAGMIGWARITDNSALTQEFPWNDMPAGTTFCDVGGGIGSVSIKMAKAHPHIKITLQDVPSVIERARSYWAKEYPQAINEQRVDFVPLDFFEETPVKAQDIYYVRHIVHDWPDEQSVAILKSVREAMKPDSRLLIHEYLLQNLYDTGGVREGALAPSPMLPNYGAGNIRPFNQDLNMMCMLNAGERSFDEFISLGAKAGLTYVSTWDFAESGMIEFKPA